MRARCFADGSDRIQDLVTIPKIYAERFLKRMSLLSGLPPLFRGL